MKPELYTYSPYLRFAGGGEKYFLGILAVLQEAMNVVLICDESELSIIKNLSLLFEMDLSKISIAATKIKSETDVQNIVPANAIFFSVTNGRPLKIHCRKSILHHQVIFKKLNETTMAERYPGHDKTLMNAEIQNRFFSQDKVFFPSNFIRDFMIDHWAIEETACSVIHPFVDDMFFEPTPPKEQTIISVGRFEPIKKQQVQIDLFDRIRPWLPKTARLTLIGSSRTSLSEKFEKIVDPSLVRIRYGLTLKEMHREYAKASIIWSTTGLAIDDRYAELGQESFGLAIAEAMASKCVPVAVNAGGITEIIESGRNGYLISDIQDFGYATVQLLGDISKTKKMATESHIRASNFSRQRFREKIEELFLA
jgi:glycosyltransferase involved in cell wall biosynthesis